MVLKSNHLEKKTRQLEIPGFMGLRLHCWWKIHVPTCFLGNQISYVELSFSRVSYILLLVITRLLLTIGQGTKTSSTKLSSGATEGLGAWNCRKIPTSNWKSGRYFEGNDSTFRILCQTFFRYLVGNQQHSHGNSHFFWQIPSKWLIFHFYVKFTVKYPQKFLLPNRPAEILDASVKFVNNLQI